jgi:hypothetical protein
MARESEKCDMAFSGKERLRRSTPIRADKQERMGDGQGDEWSMFEMRRDSRGYPANGQTRRTGRDE